MANKLVTVHNPETGLEAQVPERALPQMPKWRKGHAPPKPKSSGSKPADNKE